jgi:hypothetical protein
MLINTTNFFKILEAENFASHGKYIQIDAYIDQHNPSLTIAYGNISHIVDVDIVTPTDANFSISIEAEKFKRISPEYSESNCIELSIFARNLAKIQDILVRFIPTTKVKSTDNNFSNYCTNLGEFLNGIKLIEPFRASNKSDKEAELKNLYMINSCIASCDGHRVAKYELPDSLTDGCVASFNPLIIEFIKSVKDGDKSLRIETTADHSIQLLSIGNWIVKTERSDAEIKNIESVVNVIKSLMIDPEINCLNIKGFLVNKTLLTKVLSQANSQAYKHNPIDITLSSDTLSIKIIDGDMDLNQQLSITNLAVIESEINVSVDPKYLLEAIRKAGSIKVDHSINKEMIKMEIETHEILSKENKSITTINVASADHKMVVKTVNCEKKE